MKIGIFYGSTTGNTESVAKSIKMELESLGDVALHNIAQSGPTSMSECDLILLGTSTWGFGEMQDDWIGNESLTGIDLNGKFAAVFGLGDQMGFGDTFVDAMGILADSLSNAGAKLIGSWPTVGYEFSSSAAVRDGRFVGLALDEDNQSSQTVDRIAQWVNQLKSEMEL